MPRKGGLAKKGTMAATAQEGQAFLEQSVTDAKKPALMAHFDNSSATSSTASKGKKSPAKKGKLAKASTMAATAQEGNTLLAGESLGDTRQMTNQKKKKTPVKASPKRATTMAKAVEDAKAVYGDSLEGAMPRKRSASKPAGAPKAKVAKASPKKKAAKRSPKKAAKASPKKAAKKPAAKKSPMKKAGTMVKTAKEGKAFLKRK